MPKPFYSIYECLQHIELKLEKPITRNLEGKIFAVKNFLWKESALGNQIILPYYRNDALGFSVVEYSEYEIFPDKQKAMGNFLEIKPDNSFDYFKLGFGDNKNNNENFIHESYKFFLDMNDNEFVKIFLGAAQSRCSKKNKFIY